MGYAQYSSLLARSPLNSGYMARGSNSARVCTSTSSPAGAASASPVHPEHPYTRAVQVAYVCPVLPSWPLPSIPHCDVRMLSTVADGGISLCEGLPYCNAIPPVKLSTSGARLESFCNRAP
ncbi:hypothetical protein Vretimale_11663 [Volvox reticuliferus]|uniref:Uncharacterized protein n=1 Tax=Volvox reticuliferus TaxID=1737510 RepID=A0A8J4LS01_9CHLO|nr:hypothetical protein Vretifemale_14726 [Volvox reticuliferus]GIM07571.1 hypothetical protein Vretimale_11663 [Volvox reticuliferus]